MNETMIGIWACITLVGLAIGCFFYMWGGRSGKWKRRFIGSLAIAITLWVALLGMKLFSFWHLLVYPLLAGAFHLGYGSKEVAKKFLRRLIYAIGVCGAGLVLTLTLGPKAWLVFIPHLGLGLWSVYLGMKNPIQAAAEEVFVCAFLNIGLMMYPFLA